MNDSGPPRPNLRWYQFSLRTLLIAVLVLGVFLGWLGSGLQRARKNRQAEAQIRSVTASRDLGVSYSRAKGEPNWLQKLLGDPGAIRIQKVRMGWNTENALKHLQGLQDMLHAWELDLNPLNSRHVEVTDAGLEHLTEATGLGYVCVAGTQVTDEGVQKLQHALPNCRIQH